MVNVEVIVNEIVDDLKIELSDEPTFKVEILRNKVKNACREVMMKRNYKVTRYTDDEILDDLFNYYSVIENLARFDYNQLGAEGEQSHTENGITRSYVSRDSLLKGVHAFVKVFP